MSKILLIVVLAAAAALAWLATRPAAPKPFAENYHRALQRYPGSDAAVDQGLERFAQVYADLTHAEIGRRVGSLYADPMYFNDSLKTFTARDALIEYMQTTAEMLEHSEVAIDQVLREGNDVFVRWTMAFETSAMGRSITSRSVGMTHLRFDDKGRILVHQDFWDSATGLYRHLPVVGYALDQVDKRMTE